MQPLQSVEISLTKEQAEAAKEIGLDLLVSDYLAPLLGRHVHEELEKLESARQALTEAEANELLALGADVDYPATKTLLAFERGEAWLRDKWSQLLEHSWTRTEVADYLDVTRGRVSQLQKEQSLYVFSFSGKNLFPQFQFIERPPIVPGLSEILPHLREGAHPVLVWEFFTTASPDLLVGGEPVSPVTWLATGHAPEEVATLIRDI